MIKVTTLNKHGHFARFRCKCGHFTDCHYFYTKYCLVENCTCITSKVSFINLLKYIWYGIGY